MRILTTSDLCYVSGGDAPSYDGGKNPPPSPACNSLGAGLWAISSWFGFGGGRTLANQVTSSCNTAVSNWTNLMNKSPNAISANDAH